MKDFISYITWLSSNGGRRQMFTNCDEKHAIEVLIRLFEGAKDEIKIFAGCLCGDVPDDPRYIAALSDFIERGGKLIIMLNSFKRDKALSSNIFKRLAFYKKEGRQLDVLLTDAIPYIQDGDNRKDVHFTVCDSKAYRLETDTNTMSAVCDFNNPEIAGKYSDFFDKVVKETEPITLDLLELFNEEA